MASALAEALASKSNEAETENDATTSVEEACGVMFPKLDKAEAAAAFRRAFAALFEEYESKPHAEYGEEEETEEE